MSVKFEETVKKAQDVMPGAEGGRIPGTSGKHPIAAAVGTAITGGRDNAGTKGYLAVRNTFPIWPGSRRLVPISRHDLLT